MVKEFIISMKTLIRCELEEEILTVIDGVLPINIKDSITIRERFYTVIHKDFNFDAGILDINVKRDE